MPDTLVLRAIRIQEHCSRRAVAAAAAALLIFVAWASAWHEAEVAHVVDRSGVALHAQKLADHHEESASSHLHGRSVDGHAAGACALLATAHAVAIAPIAPAAAAIEAIAADPVAPPSMAVRTGIAGYRLAPKTSPPVRA